MACRILMEQTTLKNEPKYKHSLYNIPTPSYAPVGWLTPVIYVYLLQWAALCDVHPCGVRWPLESQWVPYATEGYTDTWHFL